MRDYNTATQRIELDVVNYNQRFFELQDKLAARRKELRRAKLKRIIKNLFSKAGCN